MIPTTLSPPQDYEAKMRFVSILSALFHEIDFEHLTVKQICEMAEVTRPTFYHYFHDKYEIVQWHSDLIAQMGIFQIGRSLNWREGYFISLHGHFEHRLLYKNVAKVRGFQALSRYSERARKENLVHTIVDHCHRELSKELLFQVSALAIAETTLAMRWMSDGFSESPSEMAELLESIVPKE
ncbi:MAG: TetR/AcrR family transcriptional regulator, partial [Coriobacteriaceae bacterium]|nr:TetR/AcrR family transcriptional regulator [Coriobacteriaceae bacterium]